MTTFEEHETLCAAFSITPDGRIASWSADAERFFGRRAGDVIGQEAALLILPEHQERFRQVLTRLRPGGPAERTRRIRAGNGGAAVDAALTLYPVERGDGTITEVLVMASTEIPLRGLDMGREESVGRYQRLFDGIPVALYRSTIDGRIIDTNATFRRLLRFPDRDTLLAVNGLDLYVDPRARDRWIVLLERDGVVTDYESELRRHDGSHMWARATAWLAPDAAGRTAYIEGAIADITERKQAAAEQAQRTAELQAFYDISRQLRAAQTPQDMYPGLVEQARALLAADHGCLALLTPDRQGLTRMYTVGIPAERSGSKFAGAGTLSGRVVAAGVPLVTADLEGDERIALTHRGDYRAVGPLALVPVRSEEEIMGTLCVARLRTSGGAPFTAAEVRLLEGIAEIAGTAIRRASLNQSLQDAYVQMVVALAHAIETRDAYTASHSTRMVALATRIARELGCSAQQIEDVRWAARLHDIGKIGISDAVLRKPTTLTSKEWAVMRQHPVLGEDILNSVDRMRGAAKFVRHHQERWDGTGYPDGLRAEAIPLGARILAVVDAYGAMTETRPYRPALGHAEAVEEIRRCAGTQFDRRVVEVFCAVVDRDENGLSAPAAPEGPPGTGRP